MGTPAFAVPCLKALFEVADVQLVVTQPDKPQGRGLTLQKPPVKLLAEEHGVRVIQPAKVRDGSLEAELRALELDFALVVAYGRILPQGVLDAPRLGCVNVHGSLLPRYRGAAPIQWAVIHGDAQTGVCLMQMDAGMDTGPELSRRVLDIGADETYGELSERLAELSGQLIREEIPRFVRGELVAKPQPEEGVSHARMLEKADGALDFEAPAQAVHDRVRGLYPWPGAFTALEGKRVKVHVTRVHERTGHEAEPGRVLTADASGIVVACGEGSVRIEALQLEGKKRMPAAVFLAGHTLEPGQRFATRAELVGAGEPA
jgi:methionyl-tRNA formyltransferase